MVIRKMNKPIEDIRSATDSLWDFTPFFASGKSFGENQKGDLSFRKIASYS